MRTLMFCLLYRQDPIYVGGKHRRVRGEAYFELVDELLTAVRRRYGTSGERQRSQWCAVLRLSAAPLQNSSWPPAA